MNLIFLSPVWLAALLPVILVGWQLLRAGRPPAATFTIPEFWPARNAFASTRASHIRKAMDWPQIGLLLAAIAATLALGRPAWKRTAQPSTPPPQIHAVGRQMENQPTAQVFVRGNAGAWKSFAIRVVAGKSTLARSVTAAALTDGIIFNDVPAAAKITVLVRAANSSGQKATLAHISLIRRTKTRPLAVNSPSAIPQPLQHLLLLMHNIVWNHPRQMPAIWILSNSAAPRRYKEFLEGLRPTQGSVVVVCLGAAAGPQMKVSGVVGVTPAVHPVIIQPDGQLFHEVDFSSVRVQRVYQATFKAGWRAEIRTGSHVWLAKRSDSANGIIWYWLASPPTAAFTDWQHHASFVIFFANLLASLTHGGADTGQTWWQANTGTRRKNSSKPNAAVTHPQTAANSRSLSPGLALFSVILTGLSLLAMTIRKTRTT